MKFTQIADAEQQKIAFMEEQLGQAERQFIEMEAQLELLEVQMEGNKDLTDDDHTAVKQLRENMDKLEGLHEKMRRHIEKTKTALDEPSSTPPRKR